MSVTNKTIRELETAAVEAVQAMNELAELLFNGGSRVLLLDRRAREQIERLRLAAIELDRAETACSRERCLTMSEAEMREEYEALGLDWDETTERGQALMQRLLAEYDAKREPEVTGVESPLLGVIAVDVKFTVGDEISTVVDVPADTSEPVDSALDRARRAAAEINAGPDPVVARVEPPHFDPRAVAKGMFPTHIGPSGAHYGDGTFLAAEQQQLDSAAGGVSILDLDGRPLYSTRKAMRDAGLPGWEHGSGLSSADAIRQLAAQRDRAIRERDELRRAAETDGREITLLMTEDEAREVAVRLDDGDITRLVADQIAEEFGLERSELYAFDRASLLRLHADLRSYAKPDSASGQMNEDQEIVLAGFMASTPRTHRRADPQLLDLPIGHQPGGLGDRGKPPRDSYDEQIERMQQSIAYSPLYSARQAAAGMFRVDRQADAAAFQRLAGFLLGLDDDESIHVFVDHRGEQRGIVVERRSPGHPRFAFMVRDPLKHGEASLREISKKLGEAVEEQRSRLSVPPRKPTAAGMGMPQPGAPIQVALGSAQPGPGEGLRMVVIIGYTDTTHVATWVSDHGMMWVRGSGTDSNAPRTADWDLTPEVDAALAKHFEGVGPLTAAALTEASERGRQARRAQS